MGRHALRATVPWDLTGSPAISVPFGWSSKGMPIGVQVVGRHFDELTVLQAAKALESHRGELRHPEGRLDTRSRELSAVGYAVHAEGVIGQDLLLDLPGQVVSGPELVDVLGELIVPVRPVGGVE